MSQSGTSAGKVLVIILLVIVGLCALAATACGGVFTVAGLGALLSSTSVNSEFAGGFLVISVPSLLVGGLITWLCFRGLRKAIAKPQPAAAAEAAPVEAPPNDPGQP